ncbi:hypothetical protein EVJ58_g8299 [Rhodofomes roseus]|uniref:DUF6535 domain-containing protein n=1 Tax=Rhodofomes roseus TaxID=34475 RepID=A0A4Y9Y3I3_9APHY|nr:hypothetical protein EVJ58_g8299 [Rhodofomes roseus]
MENVFEKYMKPRDPQKEEDAWPAGLFSAVLTGFVGPYYAVLLPPPDFNTVILERISAQLGNMSSNPAVVPGSSSSPFPPAPPAPRWIATLWFASLVFSLGAASVALAVNQWLNFHAEQWGLLTVQQKVRTWQLRRESLNKWNVEFIVSLLPCLLQVALILFIVGMVGYLWVLGPDIAVLSTVLVGASLMFLASTSVLPALVPYSPYKSPQAWWICQACRGMRWGIYWIPLQFCHMILPLLDYWYWHVTGFSEMYAWQIRHWTKKVRTSLAERRNLASTLMKKRDWLAHEQACLDGSEEKALFWDIYTIAQDLDVLRAMATCARAMPIARAIKNVVEIGQKVANALSNRQYSDSSHSVPGDQLLSDDLGRTATALIGRMALDAFLRTQTGLDDDTHALDSDYRRMLAGLIRAMPLADGQRACMSLFQHLRDGRLSTKQQRATLEVIQDVYISIDILAEDALWGSPNRYIMQKVRKFECAPHTELYRLRDVQGKSSIYFGYNRCKLKFGIDWECMQTALTTVYAHRDPVSAIQIATTVLVICMLSVKNEHTSPAEPSRGAYLADTLHRFDEHLATLRRKELRDAIQALPPAATYRLDWVLYRMTDWDIYKSLSTTEIRQNAMMSTNRIARRLQWLLECDVWTPSGTVQGFNVRLGSYAEWAQLCLEEDRIDTTDLGEGWLECAPDEPQSEGDRKVDSPEAAGPGPTEAGDEQARDLPEPRPDHPKRSITQSLVDAVHRLTCRRRAPDVEMQAVGAGSESNAAPDAPVATTLDESESPHAQGPDAAQTESVHPREDTKPHAHDFESDDARAVAEAGTSAGEGRLGGLAGAIKYADIRQGSDAHSSLEGGGAPGDVPAQPSASHQELGRQSRNSG